MSIQVGLHHRTHYRYDRPVVLSPQVVRLRPAPHARTRVPGYSLRIQPSNHFINWQQDPHGNYLARLVFPEPVTEFLVEVDLVADLVTINPFDFFLEPEAETVPFAYAPELAQDLAPYLKLAEAGPALASFVAALRAEGVRSVNYLVDLNQRVQQEVRYLIRMEPGVQTPEQTLVLKSGSCRDSAWLLVQVLRRLGIAARFVSGYLIQLAPDEKPLEGPAGPSADFTDLHAWAEAYLPGAGWVGLDPTSGLFAGEGHIPLAATPEPQSAAPITGSVEDCETQFHFHMSVRRVHESPRVTKPYAEEEWAEMDALGERVDAALQEGDVRLTMGGEPTFVAVDNMDGDEWNTLALGPQKRLRGDELLRRLHVCFARGGLLHHGQGKWYPGEPLPRWAFSTFWRKDGEPVWTRPELLDTEASPRSYGPGDAERFARALAAELGVSDDFLEAGYEDAWYHLWRERRLPVNVDPLKSNLKEPEERERLSKIFEQGLDKVVGYALPLRRARDAAGPCWTTGPWFFRPERMYLIPGDSPMGFRLPLDSLAPRGVLPPREAFARTERQTQRPDAAAPDRALAAKRATSASWVNRTALVVEPRNGHLYVFMPPAAELEDYLDLVAAVEETAARLAMPLHPRMSLAQQLLVRGLVAWFWREPYRAKLARWGTEAHDKFMLPHFVWEDFDGVLHDLREAGFDFRPAWFRPHHAFRFPTYGSVTVRGAVVELRQALEPWHVLGEEAGGGGTVRYVDSSVERVQVKATNFDPARYAIACGGLEVPLFPSGVAGEYVAGVRYRAWQPPNCLHPAIDVHTPLVFDVVDTWNGRAAGGCTYYVAHPGGRNYETFPVNALEAESRRIARFVPAGHTPGAFRMRPAPLNREFPMTLDLRRSNA